MHIISHQRRFFSFNKGVSVGFSSPRKRSQLGHYWPYKLQPRRGSLCCVLVDFGKRLGRQRYENGRFSNVFLLEWDVIVVGKNDVLVVRLRFHCWGRHSKLTPSTCLSEHLPFETIKRWTCGCISFRGYVSPSQMEELKMALKILMFKGDG